MAIRLEPIVQEFQVENKNALAAVKGIDSAIGLIIKTATAGLVAIGALGAGLTAIGLVSAKEAARVDELALVNQVLAKNMGLSGEAVKLEAAEVKKMGIEAAVAQEVVAEFAKNQLDLAKASDLARVAQDFAVISGENSTETTKRLIWGITTLQPEVLRTAGVTVNLQQAYEDYADSVGKTTQELSYQEKQQIALNEVLKAGESVTGAYEASMTEASKVMRSMPRYINDIQVNIGTHLKEAYSNAVFAGAEFVKNLGEATAEGGALEPILQAVGKVLAEVTAKGLEWVRNIDWEGVRQKATRMADHITMAFDYLKKMWNNHVLPAGRELSRLWDNLNVIGQKLDGNTANVDGKFTALGATFRVVIGAIAATGDFLSVLSGTLNIINTLLERGIGLWDRFAGAARGASGAVSNIPSIPSIIPTSAPSTSGASTGGRAPRGRANQGDLGRGMLTAVNERRQELFLPGQTGSVRSGLDINVKFSDEELDRIGRASARALKPVLQRMMV